ncbi:MAG: hypothetical protein MUC60_09940 [Oscillatoria sp. Prado101]|jgi:hypothetical protein|nr:hypothetical protein [Oscillatoria sp. Prado101]
MKAGDTVAAKWGQDGYYLARIVGGSGDEYEVIYAHGDSNTLSPKEIVPISPAGSTKIGDPVLAANEGSKMYSGVVVEKLDGGGAYSVQWDSGEEPSVVPADKIAKFPIPLLKPGNTVAAKWSEGGYYFARIVSVKGDSYDIIHGDGNTATLSARDIIPISPAAGTIKVGDSILGVWEGDRMYTGTVTEKIEGGNAYIVQWDKGTTPSVVPASQIAKLP